jgi:hypothetical protein
LVLFEDNDDLVSGFDGHDLDTDPSGREIDCVPSAGRVLTGRLPDPLQIIAGKPAGLRILD